MRLLGALALLMASSSASADPCGMVPPISVATTRGPAIERTGVQNTYALFRDGVQTLVIRPGFKGKVDEFGMLVPFPSVPAIRKINDDTFAHLAAAVDPPIVDVTVYEPRYEVVELDSASIGRADSGLKFSSKKPDKDEVRVVKQEAIGMYEVAVLEAGSAKALSVWMADNAYRYPTGMDGVVEDYVGDGWVFVAIKAKVGQLPGVAPKPGMRGVDPKLPTGAEFEGHVQGMGFRFAVSEPVVPMRLSTFNGDDLHNRVYFLTSAPVRIAGIDDDLVVRQLSGKQVYDNVTEPLQVRWRGGGPGDIAPGAQQRIDAVTRPAQYNGIAKELIATDLLASRTGSLTLGFEEREKALLNISEAFGMRGPAVDQLHQAVVAEERGRAIETAFDDVLELKLTVFDGEFPKAYLRDHNLTFAAYAMPAARNRPEVWNQRMPGPQLSFERVR